MSEGNQGPSARRPPVIEDDDRPTAEIPAAPPASGSSRQDAKDGQASGQPAGGQPGASASGWTPSLSGRQAPQPPPAKPAAAPRPTAGPARPTPAPAGATPPSVRPSAGPRPTPGPPTARPPAAGSEPTKSSSAAAPASPTATGDALAASESAKASPSGAKAPFWHKVTDALGFERKSRSGTTGDQLTDRAPGAGGTPGSAAAAAPAAAATTTATATQPGPSASAPTAPVPAPTHGPRPQSGNARPGVPATAPSPAHPGPPQYRVGNPPQSPGAPVRPGAAAGSGAAGATALQVAATPGQGTHAGETRVGGAKPLTRRTRKARLRLSRLDPWSVMKTSFLFAIAAGIMLVVAVYAIWVVLSASGLFASINDIVASVVSTPGDTTPFQIQDYLDTQRIMGIAALIACVDVVIFTALATLASFLYNLAATMLGGLEVTLAED